MPRPFAWPEINTTDFHLRVESAECDAGRFFRLNFTYGPNEAVFIISAGGDAVWVSWRSGGLDELLMRRGVAALLQGCVWGALLALRGTVWLHGAAVRIGANAIALLGKSGAGKSTLAGALMGRDARLLADDKTIIAPCGTDFLIEAGRPNLRLWPDSLEALGLPVMFRKHRMGASGKRLVEPFGGGQGASICEMPPSLLNRIYILDSYEHDLLNVEIEPLSRVDGLYELLTYRYGLFAATTAQISRECLMLARLTERVPVRRLRRPNDLQKLWQSVSAIRKDLEGNVMEGHAAR